MNTARYFKDKDTYWKFEPGQRPKMKAGFYAPWGDSFFRNLADFLADPIPVREIAMEEAEEARKVPVHSAWFPAFGRP